MKVWVCQVRKEAFVGGESQRCRHTETCLVCEGIGKVGDVPCRECGATGQYWPNGCGVMELIGGEPIDYCVRHSSPGWSNSIGVTDDECYEVVFIDSEASGLDCQFESQIRVAP